MSISELFYNFHRYRTSSRNSFKVVNCMFWRYFNNLCVNYICHILIFCFPWPLDFTLPFGRPLDVVSCFRVANDASLCFMKFRRCHLAKQTRDRKQSGTWHSRHSLVVQLLTLCTILQYTHWCIEPNFWRRWSTFIPLVEDLPCLLMRQCQ